MFGCVCLCIYLRAPVYQSIAFMAYYLPARMQTSYHSVSAFESINLYSNFMAAIMRPKKFIAAVIRVIQKHHVFGIQNISVPDFC